MLALHTKPRLEELLPVSIPKTRRSNCKKWTSVNYKIGRLARRGFPRHRQVTLRQRDYGPEAGTRRGNSAINRLARSARALASFASYAGPLLSQTGIVSWGP
jgi:hypothetical protein